MITVQVSSEAATRTPPERLYLDDLHVGQRFTSGTYRLDEAQIKAFALQFDPQPFHTDEHAAERTLFKGLAASGWDTAAITMSMNVESGPPLAGGFVGAGGEVSWPAPTRSKDVLHVESEVVEVTPYPLPICVAGQAPGAIASFFRGRACRHQVAAAARLGRDGAKPMPRLRRGQHAVTLLAPGVGSTGGSTGSSSHSASTVGCSGRHQRH